MAALNPQYETIGKTFVQKYYACFDSTNKAERLNLGNFYIEDKSLMTFEGQQIFGKTKIVEKIRSLPFKNIAHAVTTVDCHPTFDGGVLVCVVGQLKTDDEQHAHSFCQSFLLKQGPSSFYVEHDVFRLVIHHTAAI